MKKLVAILSLLSISSTVFADQPQNGSKVTLSIYRMFSATDSKGQEVRKTVVLNGSEGVTNFKITNGIVDCEVQFFPASTARPDLAAATLYQIIDGKITSSESTVHFGDSVNIANQDKGYSCALTWTNLESTL